MRELTEAWPETAEQHRTDRTTADTGTMQRPAFQPGVGKNSQEFLESRRDALQRLFTLVGLFRTCCAARPHLVLRSVLRMEAFFLSKTRDRRSTTIFLARQDARKRRL